jgi:hypothetical protein
MVPVLASRPDRAFVGCDTERPCFQSHVTARLTSSAGICQRSRLTVGLRIRGALVVEEAESGGDVSYAQVVCCLLDLGGAA